MNAKRRIQYVQRLYTQTVVCDMSHVRFSTRMGMHTTRVPRLNTSVFGRLFTRTKTRNEGGVELERSDMHGGGFYRYCQSFGGISGREDNLDGPLSFDVAR